MEPGPVITNSSLTRNHEILVIENDASFLNQLKQLLGHSQHLHHAASGLDALDMIENDHHAFDLVITEIHLPDMSGIEVIKRARNAGRELLFMVITNSQNENDFFSAIRAGAHGYLMKSDVSNMLTGAIDDILSNQYPVSLPFSKYFFKLAGSPITSNFNDQFNISPRELELLKFIAQGNSYAECAELMQISLSTIQTHIRNMYRKMAVCNQRQAVKIAHEFGLLHQ